MAIEYTNLAHSKTLQKLPKLGFWVSRYTIWQPWKKLSEIFAQGCRQLIGKTNKQKERNIFCDILCRTIRTKVTSFGSSTDVMIFKNIFAEKFSKKIGVFDSKQS
jgi:hypothetical protein